MIFIFYFLIFCTNSFILRSQTTPWYYHTTIYQIYPRSFYDSDDDGIGDIAGIIQKLDYLKNLGVETIWLSPVFYSPQADFGYDISNYLDVAPEYGAMKDMEKLINEVHQRGMKIILDLVMNHTSMEHSWFQSDVNRPSDQRGQDKDFYVWRDRPNNWKNALGKRAWHYHPLRRQYYYAAFLPFQPDLNYHNPQVRQAMLDVARFWLEKGVDGFRLDLFNYIFEDSLFRNNPCSLNPITGFQKPRFTRDRDATFRLAEDLRQLCQQYGPKMLLGEVVGPLSVVKRYVGDAQRPRLTHAFYFEMLRFRFSARYFEKLLRTLDTAFPPPLTPVYAFSNHDRRRMLSRLHKDTRKARLVHAVQFLARGIPCLYYGEEIGMTDSRFPYRKSLDPLPRYLKIPRFIVSLFGETTNRDEVRTPMLWNSGPHAGFTKASKPWLPIHGQDNRHNVASALSDSSSLFYFIQTLIQHRRPDQPLQIERQGPVLRLNNALLNFSKKKRPFYLVGTAQSQKVFVPPISVTWLNNK
ncbi:MAG: alpha-amylase family glycosyl hydrolase [Flavobacteriales bacterium]|nr:alpha-amylase family glycosyl hydrolase [Flavobacteriales bacterium]MCX7768605.1 alpha-amylase family glycosyl hydrolase [Flavobacteriales bacterium]MDW8409741.1 alpha-amylase family glycosyl hydrolase [Flavobacteriales bacterium]